MLTLSLAIACSRPAPPPVDGPLPESPLVADALLARARARWAGAAVPEAPVLGHPAPPLWLCYYPPREAFRCAPGAGDTLAEAVDDAVNALSPAGDPVGAWKIDLQLDKREAMWPKDADPRAAATFGVSVGEAIVLPSEFLERELYEGADDPPYNERRLRKLLAERGATVPPNPEAPFAFALVHTASWVWDSAAAHAVRTYRLHAHDDVDVTDPEVVLTRAVHAAEHLASLVGPEGKIRYRYDPADDRSTDKENLLRHAGSTYALLTAYERTAHAPWRDAAQRAVGYLLAQSATDTRSGPYGGGTARYLVEGAHIKLGGAGLGLLALATWQRVTGGAEHLPQAREFATFLLSQQQKDGEFVYFAAREPGGEPRDDTSDYYPGEAILGLVSLYALDPDPRWLAAARRGADWLIDVRDAGKPPADLQNDHWLMIALDRLHAATDDPRYLAHAQKLAAAVGAKLGRRAERNDDFPDFAGAYNDPPTSTPASVRVEGLVAVVDLLERTHTDHDLKPLLLTTLRHSLRSQVTPVLGYWMEDPEDAIGGWMAGVTDPEMRNDYTQHALSALLGTERILGPIPGPVDVEARLARW